MAFVLDAKFIYETIFDLAWPCSSVAFFKRLTTHNFHPHRKAGRCRRAWGFAQLLLVRSTSFYLSVVVVRHTDELLPGAVIVPSQRSVRSSSYFELTLLCFLLSI